MSLIRKSEYRINFDFSIMFSTYLKVKETIRGTSPILSFLSNKCMQNELCGIIPKDFKKFPDNLMISTSHIEYGMWHIERKPST